MEYEQLNRCYKTVLAQRDRAEVEVVKLTCKVEDLQDVIDDLALNAHKVQEWKKNYRLTSNSPIRDKTTET